MGGTLGGYLFASQPNYHYLADDLDQALVSLGTVLSQTSGTLYVGHGGPLSHPKRSPVAGNSPPEPQGASHRLPPFQSHSRCVLKHGDRELVKVSGG